MQDVGTMRALPPHEAYFVGSHKAYFSLSGKMKHHEKLRKMRDLRCFGTCCTSTEPIRFY